MKKNWLKRNLANIITSSRIIATLVMFFMPDFSKAFFISYTYAGLTDFIDGPIARKTNTVSKIGSKLDSVSDLLLYVLMMVKMIPYLKLYLPKYVWTMIFSTVGARILMYTYVGIKHHTFMSNHVFLNKATGFSIFFVPYFIRFSWFKWFATAVASVAILACLHEAKLVFVDHQVSLGGETK